MHCCCISTTSSGPNNSEFGGIQKISWYLQIGHICHSIKHTEITRDFTTDWKVTFNNNYSLFTASLQSRSGCIFCVAFIFPTDIGCFKEVNPGLIYHSVKCCTSDLYLNYQLHVDYVTCLSSDLFLFSIWYSWCRVFLSYKSYNLEEPTLISSGALWKVSRVRLTCGDRAFQHSLRKNCFWAHMAARYNLHAQRHT